MIDKINTERHEHIITIEDPIEFLHQHKSCVVNQREVGTDTHSFKKALALGAAPGPGRGAGRRDARPRDHRGGADHRRDRPPLLRHAAHQLGAADHQPRHRRLPAAPAVADPRAALVRAGRRGLPDAAAEGLGRGARGRAGGDDPELGDPEPDPRRQAAPDLLADADWPGHVGHADAEPVPGGAVPEAAGHARGRDRRQLRRQRAAADHRLGRWRRGEQGRADVAPGGGAG